MGETTLGAPPTDNDVTVALWRRDDEDSAQEVITRRDTLLHTV